MADDEEPRWMEVHVGGPDGPTLTMCLWCGCLVGAAEALHVGRCYAEEVQREVDSERQAAWEEDVADGLYDDEIDEIN